MTDDFLEYHRIGVVQAHPDFDGLGWAVVVFHWYPWSEDRQTYATRESAWSAAREASAAMRQREQQMCPDWLAPIMQAIAATLAEPLRKALDEHLAEHGCGCDGSCRDPRHLANGGHAIGGFGNCPVGAQLFRLLPDGDKVLIA